MPDMVKQASFSCAVATLLLALFCALSCESEGSESEFEGSRTLESVRGIVLEVEAESLISLNALDVQDESGKLWHFEGRGRVVPGFTPSHLNEHKLLGQSVLVTFYRDGEALVLQDIAD